MKPSELSCNPWLGGRRTYLTIFFPYPSDLSHGIWPTLNLYWNLPFIILLEDLLKRGFRGKLCANFSNQILSHFTPAMISSLQKSFEHKTKYEAIMRCTENQNRLLTLIVKLQNAWLTIFVVITHDISLCIISITKEEKVNKILT